MPIILNGAFVDLRILTFTLDTPITLHYFVRRQPNSSDPILLFLLRELDTKILRVNTIDPQLDPSRGEQIIRTIINEAVGKDHQWASLPELRLLKTLGLISKHAPKVALILPATVIRILRHFQHDIKALILESVLLTLLTEQRILKQMLLTIKSNIYFCNFQLNLQHDLDTSHQLIKKLIFQIYGVAYPPPWHRFFKRNINSKNSIKVDDEKDAKNTTNKTNKKNRGNVPILDLFCTMLLETTFSNVKSNSIASTWDSLVIPTGNNTDMESDDTYSLPTTRRTRSLSRHRSNINTNTDTNNQFTVDHNHNRNITHQNTTNDPTLPALEYTPQTLTNTSKSTQKHSNISNNIDSHSNSLITASPSTLVSNPCQPIHPNNSSLPTSGTLSTAASGTLSGPSSGPTTPIVYISQYNSTHTPSYSLQQSQNSNPSSPNQLINLSQSPLDLGSSSTPSITQLSQSPQNTHSPQSPLLPAVCSDDECDSSNTIMNDGKISDADANNNDQKTNKQNSVSQISIIPSTPPQLNHTIPTPHQITQTDQTLTYSDDINSDQTNQDVDSLDDFTDLNKLFQNLSLKTLIAHNETTTDMILSYSSDPIMLASLSPIPPAFDQMQTNAKVYEAISSWYSRWLKTTAVNPISALHLRVHHNNTSDKQPQVVDKNNVQDTLQIRSNLGHQFNTIKNTNNNDSIDSHHTKDLSEFVSNSLNVTNLKNSNSILLNDINIDPLIRQISQPSGLLFTDIPPQLASIPTSTFSASNQQHHLKDTSLKTLTKSLLSTHFGPQYHNVDSITFEISSNIASNHNRSAYMNHEVVHFAPTTSGISFLFFRFIPSSVWDICPDQLIRDYPKNLLRIQQPNLSRVHNEFFVASSTPAPNLQPITVPAAKTKKTKVLAPHLFQPAVSKLNNGDNNDKNNNNNNNNNNSNDTMMVSGDSNMNKAQVSNQLSNHQSDSNLTSLSAKVNEIYSLNEKVHFHLLNIFFMTTVPTSSTIDWPLETFIPAPQNLDCENCMNNYFNYIETFKTIDTHVLLAFQSRYHFFSPCLCRLKGNKYLAHLLERGDPKFYQFSYVDYYAKLLKGYDLHYSRYHSNNNKNNDNNNNNNVICSSNNNDAHNNNNKNQSSRCLTPVTINSPLNSIPATSELAKLALAPYLTPNNTEHAGIETTNHTIFEHSTLHNDIENPANNHNNSLNLDTLQPSMEKSRKINSRDHTTSDNNNTHSKNHTFENISHNNNPKDHLEALNNINMKNNNDSNHNQDDNNDSNIDNGLRYHGAYFNSAFFGDSSILTYPSIVSFSTLLTLSTIHYKNRNPFIYDGDTTTPESLQQYQQYQSQVLMGSFQWLYMNLRCPVVYSTGLVELDDESVVQSLFQDNLPPLYIHSDAPLDDFKPGGKFWVKDGISADDIAEYYPHSAIDAQQRDDIDNDDNLGHDDNNNGVYNNNHHDDDDDDDDPALYDTLVESFGRQLVDDYGDVFINDAYIGTPLASNDQNCNDSDNQNEDHKPKLHLHNEVSSIDQALELFPYSITSTSLALFRSILWHIDVLSPTHKLRLFRHAGLVFTLDDSDVLVDKNGQPIVLPTRKNTNTASIAVKIFSSPSIPSLSLPDNDNNSDINDIDVEHNDLASVKRQKTNNDDDTIGVIDSYGVVSLDKDVNIDNEVTHDASTLQPPQPPVKKSNRGRKSLQYHLENGTQPDWARSKLRKMRAAAAAAEAAAEAEAKIKEDGREIDMNYENRFDVGMGQAVQQQQQQQELYQTSELIDSTLQQNDIAQHYHLTPQFHSVSDVTFLPSNQSHTNQINDNAHLTHFNTTPFTTTTGTSTFDINNNNHNNNSNNTSINDTNHSMNNDSTTSHSNFFNTFDTQPQQQPQPLSAQYISFDSIQTNHAVLQSPLSPQLNAYHHPNALNLGPTNFTNFTNNMNHHINDTTHQSHHIITGDEFEQMYGEDIQDQSALFPGLYGRQLSPHRNQLSPPLLHNDAAITPLTFSQQSFGGNHGQQQQQQQFQSFQPWGSSPLYLSNLPTTTAQAQGSPNPTLNIGAVTPPLQPTSSLTQFESPHHSR